MIKAWRKKRAERPSSDILMPPEGVPLTLKIAGLGVRFAAQLTDVLITVIAAIAFLLLLAALGVTSPSTWFAIMMLLFFMIRVPYYVVTELVWNGQTLGKRLLKIKVVAHDAGPLSTHAIVLRNLMKEAEIFLPGTLLLTLDAEAPVSSIVALGWTCMAIAIPLFNPHKRRLGDLVAGTHVIHLPEPILLKDMAKAKTERKTRREPFTFLPHQLDHYGAFELQTLEGLLRAQGTLSRTDQNEQTLAAIAEKIRNKITYADPVQPADRVAFLQAFYTAQRAHLEQRQLFGDKRTDKHHATTKNAP